MTVAFQDKPQAHVRMSLMHRTHSLGDGQEKRSFADPGRELRMDAQFLQHLTSHGVHRALTRFDMPALVSTYLAQGPLAAQEMQYVDAFRRLREVVQGAYFAGRLVTNDFTGGIDQAENEKGLNDARRRLGALGS